MALSPIPIDTCYTEFALTVRNICVGFRGSVTGGGRTEKRNAKLPGGGSGHSNSRHLWKRRGAAEDIVFDTITGYKGARRFARRLGLKVIEYENELRLHIASLGEWVPE